MPKATLEFALPEEQTEHDDAINGTNWRLIVEELWETAHAKAKHGEDDAEAIQWTAIAEQISRSVETRGLQMWVW